MNKQLLIGLSAIFILFIISLCIRFDRPLYISSEEAAKMGAQIWHNEGGRKIEKLTWWNQGEDFASLGIGHFIWYPVKTAGPFRETFPDFLAFLKQKGVKLPAWLEKVSGCPWLSREAFYADLHSPEMIQLRQLLVDHIDLQIIFMVNRLQKALPNILKTLPADRKQHVIVQFYRAAKTSAGLYALLDYLNFKGEGLSCRECYGGEGWGLLQVLENMPGNTRDPIKEFVETAKLILARRVERAPPERKEQRWLPGWYNRLDTYLKFSI